MRRILLAVLFVCALVASGVPALLHVAAVDRCLDAGGTYDYSVRICRHDVVSLPAPSWRTDADFVSGARAFLALVVTGLIASAISYPPLRRLELLRGFVRWGGMILLGGYALMALHYAAFSTWVSSGPPKAYPQAWLAQAVRCFWLSVALLFTATWLFCVLRPRTTKVT